MNTKIEQLTRTYLDSLNLNSPLSSEQKRKIINLNANSEWIIFNASSLQARSVTREHGYTPMLYVDERGEIYDRHRDSYRPLRDFMQEHWNEINLASPTDYELGELEEDPNYRWSSRRPVYGYLLTHEGRRNSVRNHLQDFEEVEGITLSPENYEIIASLLQEIGKETLKIYYPRYAATQSPPLYYNLNNLDCESFNFIGGAGGESHYKQAAIPVGGLWGSNEGRGDQNYWVAVNKSQMPKHGYQYNESTVCLNRAHWKIESQWSLNDLLNDPQINNSEEQSAIPNQTGNTSNNTNTANPPHSYPSSTPPPQDAYDGQSRTFPTSTTQTIQFKIKSIIKYEGDIFDIEVDSPIAVNDGIQIAFIDILGRKARTAFQNGDLRPGNTIAVTNIRFAPNRAKITSSDELWIGKSYDEIRVISSANPSSTSSPDSPPLPTFFPEVEQKNQELSREGNKMDLLVEELLKVIEDNNQICQKAQSLGLNLPEIPSDALNYFQEEFFTFLDENQPLNSSHNSQINTKNENIKNKKLNIKKNIYGIYDSNKKRLAERKSDQTPPPPANSLEKLKQEVKERINQILTDKDNLRNINLTTLANGKYQNWEKDIEGLTSKEEVIDYVRDFVDTLKEVGAKEKEKEQKEKNEGNKNNPDNSQNSSENSFIDNNVRKKISGLPLPVSKIIAKNKIRELFKKYHPDLESIKGVWEGEKSWMSFLEKCTSSEEVLTFMEKLEKAIIQQSQKSQEKDKKNSISQESWILLFMIIGLVVVISLVIIIKLSYKRKRKKIK